MAANLSLLGEDRPPFPPSLPFVRIKDAKEDLFSHILKLAPLSPPLRTPRRSVCKRKKFPPRMTSSELVGTRVLSPSSFSRIPRGGNQFCIWEIKLSASLPIGIVHDTFGILSWIARCNLLKLDSDFLREWKGKDVYIKRRWKNLETRSWDDIFKS